MKQAETKQKSFTVKNELMIFALSAAFSLTLLLFSPVSFYMDAPAAFMLDFPTLLPGLVTEALMATLVLGGLLNLMLRIHKWAYLVLSRLLTGLLAGFTVQTFLLNGRMGQVLSNDVRYGRYRAEIIANAVLFWTVTALPLLLTILGAVLRNGKLSRFTAGRPVVIFSAALMALHMGQAAVKTASTDYKKYNGIQNYYLSYEQTLSLSDKGNVIVIVADRLDSLWMDEMLEKYPELYDEFSGFTFYQNAISTGTSTFPTVPEFLTGRKYDGEDWPDYLTDAWSGNTVPAQLKANGWQVYLLPDRITTLSSPAQVWDQCDNIKDYGREMKPKLLGKRGLWLGMMRLSAARMAPYHLKHGISYWLGANFCRFMIKDADSESDWLPTQTSFPHDIRYNAYLNSHSITADAPGKVFSFLHLNCCHDVNDTIASFHGFTGENDIYKTIRGDFETIFEYFRQMKAAGVFDNSTIIVMGDHGRAPRELQGSCQELESAITTAVLIKPENAGNVPLKKDRDSQLSLEYFPASILEYAGLPHEGITFRDVIGGGHTGRRSIRSYDFAGYGCMEWQAAYEVEGDARDFNNWTRLDE